MTQYQRELEQVKANGGDVESFEKEWFERACKAYRNHKGDINDFRRGKVKI